MLRSTRRWLRWTLAAAVLAQALPAAGDRAGAEGWGRTERAYDGRFTFVRLRWRPEPGRFGRGTNQAWDHDFPRAEQNLQTILKELTLVDANTEGSLILTLDDPQLFKYPTAFMWEPGFWTMSDREAARFREYLLKGLIRCAHCLMPMWAQTYKSGRRYYR